MSAPRRLRDPAARATFWAWLALGLAMAASAALLLYWGRGQTIRGDELGYAARLADQPFLHAVFHSPPNKYFIAVPLILYDALFALFGIARQLPFRLVSTALVLLCAVSFFLIARRRVRDVAALPPTILLLFFGSGWETVMTPIRIPSLIAVAAGLAALLAVGRRDWAGDGGGALLLSIAVASHPVGLAFLAAGGILVVARPGRQRWTSLWAVAIPAAVFAAWWAFLRSPTTNVIFPTHVSDVIDFALNSWTAVTAHVTGLAGVIAQPSFAQAIAQALAAALFALLVVVLTVRRGRAPATFWAAVAGFVVLVVSTRLSPGGFLRSPEEVRYLFPEAVLFLLMLIELAALVRLSAAVSLVATAVMAAGLTYNVVQLRNARTDIVIDSRHAVGLFSAYELAGSRLHGGYSPGALSVPARDYVAAKRYGSIALSPTELEAAPISTRLAADMALAGSLHLAVRPSRSASRDRRVSPEVAQVLDGRVTKGRSCLHLVPTSPKAAAATAVPLNPNPSQKTILERVARGRPPAPMATAPELAVLSSPPGQLLLRARDIKDVAILVGRFASPPSAQLPQPKPGRAGVLRLPSNGLDVPWAVTVASARPVQVCGAPGPSRGNG